MVIFDGSYGFVAGFQAAVHKNVTQNDKYYDYSNSEFYQEGEFFSEKVSKTKTYI